MIGLGIAFSFLTRIPVRRHVSSGGELGAAVGWFPVVGAVVGAIVGVVAVALASVAPALAAGLLAVGVGMLVTGAFHEDGWADTFDGLAGGYTAERRLEIMKDSRLGTFGAAALFVALGSKAVLIAELTSEPWWRTVAVVAVAGAVSRAVSVSWMSRARPASPGLGSEYLAAVRPFGVAAAGLIGVALSVAVGPAGLVGLAGAVLVGAGPVWWARRAIGGITGDILGAVQVAAEVTFLIGVVAVRWWW